MKTEQEPTENLQALQHVRRELRVLARLRRQELDVERRRQSRRLWQHQRSFRALRGSLEDGSALQCGGLGRHSKRRWGLRKVAALVKLKTPVCEEIPQRERPRQFSEV